MGKNLALIVQLSGGQSSERGLTSVFGQTSEDEFQITFKVFEADGVTPILPSNLGSGDITVSIRPTGQGDFVQADHVIDLTNNEFFRPFRVNPDAIKFNVENLDPVDALIEARITAV